MKFSILIPTRNRANTIGATIKTCLAQDDVELEIIICDNASTDATAEIVADINDPRVQHHYFEELVSMSLNWERGLNLVSGTHLILIGSDDALIPRSLKTLGRLFSYTKSEAINWLRPNYNWPDIQLKGHENVVYIPPLDSRKILIKQNSILNIKQVYKNLTNYAILPTLYNSAISIELIQRIRKISKSGRLFNCQIPDVYSGIVVASMVGEYYTSNIPFSINGGSGNSNGVATFGLRNNNPILSEFQTLNKASNLSYDPIIPDIYCDCTVIGEAALKAADEFPEYLSGYNINMEDLYRHAFVWIENYFSTEEKPDAYLKLQKAVTAYNQDRPNSAIPLESVKKRPTEKVYDLPQSAKTPGRIRNLYHRLRSVSHKKITFSGRVLSAPSSIKDIEKIAIILGRAYARFYEQLSAQPNLRFTRISRFRFVVLIRAFKKLLAANL